MKMVYKLNNKRNRDEESEIEKDQKYLSSCTSKRVRRCILPAPRQYVFPTIAAAETPKADIPSPVKKELTDKQKIKILESEILALKSKNVIAGMIYKRNLDVANNKAEYVTTSFNEMRKMVKHNKERLDKNYSNVPGDLNVAHLSIKYINSKLAACLFTAKRASQHEYITLFNNEIKNINKPTSKQDRELLTELNARFNHALDISKDYMSNNHVVLDNTEIDLMLQKIPKGNITLNKN